jgi:hypothetical protein
MMELAKGKYLLWNRFTDNKKFLMQIIWCYIRPMDDGMWYFEMSARNTLNGDYQVFHAELTPEQMREEETWKSRTVSFTPKEILEFIQTSYSPTMSGTLELSSSLSESSTSQPSEE